MIQSRWPAANERSESEPSNYRDLLREATVQIRRLRNRLDDVEQRQTEPIAIVGMACRFPGGANNPDAYWQLLRDGIDAVGKIPDQRWNIDSYYDSDPAAPGKMYTRSGSFVNNVDQFDPQFFGISPREAHSLDPQQRLLLETSYTALENAGIPAFDQKGSATGVFVGLSFDDYAQRSVRSGDPAQIDAFSSLGNTRSIAAGRIAYVFGFQGPTMQLDTTCSSSLLAVHLACQSLRSGECNLALAGGVNLMLSPEVTIGFCKLQALSPDGRCKTFDATADGYGRGEGCGVVVLKRLGDAVANQDKILGLVKGSAVNHDGVSNGLTAPNGSAQTAVIRQAMLNAKLTPQQIQYVEAHGTGTSLGDPIELIALNQALKDRSTPLLVGSVKTNFGHLEAAAGMAGLMKIILSLQHQQIPPHLHLDTPNPHIPWDRLAIQVPTQLTPWPATQEPKRAGLSGFGMSGTNVHIILEEATPTADATMPVETERPLHILTLSARSDTALKDIVQRYQTWLTNSENTLADICFTANTGRSHFNHRLALSAADTAQMGQKLGNVSIELSAKNTRQIFLSHHHKISFLFTGQGCQYVGMGRELYETESVFRDAVNRCDQILSRANIPLLEILYPDLEQSTNYQLSIHDTAYTQPTLFSIEYALAELWQSWGIEPEYVLGHSIGEYAAACIAGVLSLEDGLRLVTARGRLMQALPAGGGMAAVMASQERVASVLANSTNGIEIAAVNAPENTVISGELQALGSVINQLEAQGISVKKLHVSHAFHSAHMEPVLAEFEQIAQSVHFSQPDIDIISSVTGQLVTTEICQPDYWVNQIRQPVKFLAAINTIAAQGSNIFIEIGPRPTLLSMGQMCAPKFEAIWLPSLSPAKIKASDHTLSDLAKTDWKTLTSSLCKLYEAGYGPDWASFDKAYPRQTVILPNYPFQRKRYWLEPAQIAAGIRQSLTKKEYSPLLGQQLSLAGNTVRCYETQLPWDAPLVWQDHRVFKSVLLPAAAYLAIALAAGKDIFKAGYGVTDVSLFKGLWLDEDTPTHLQTILTRQAENYQFEIHSRQENAWIKHGVGILKPLSQLDLPKVAIANIQARLTNKLSAQQFYQRYSARGIDYGPSFQAVQQIWMGDTEALARVDVPSADATFQMHPVLLDAGLQLAGATLGEETTTTYLPIAIGQFSCHQPAQAVWVYAQRRLQQTAQQTGQPVIDITWADAEHQVVAKLHGLTLQSVELDSEPIDQTHSTEWLHQIRWQPQLLPQTPGEFLLPPGDVRDAIAPQFTQLIQQSDFLRYQQIQPDLNTLAVAYILQAFLELEWVSASEKPFTSEELANTLGILPQHRQLFERCLTLLSEAKILNLVNDLSPYQWQVTASLPLSDPQQQLQRLQQQPALAAELTLLSRCGENLAAVFQGTVNPLALLFPEGDLTALTQLYQSSAGAQVMNQLVQAAVTQAVSQTSQERPLRILEIGAGTGGTTASLLPQLADLRQAISYLFTDISPRFTTAAQAQFQAYPFVEYALLDIERPPTAQGFNANFDLVIAANVLHATADIEHTLNHVRDLLAPGGQLVLLEGTQPVGWIDLIFGLTPGWWAFTDSDLRPNHPLLSVSQWQQVLENTGFDTAINLKPENSTELSQSVIVAQANTGAAKQWLITGETETTDALSISLKNQRQTVEIVDTVSSIEPVQCADRLGGLIFALPSATDQTVTDIAKLTCQHILTLVQTLTQLPQPPRLYVISADDALSHLAQSSLWGIIQTIQLEHPELHCTHIQADASDTLVAELLANSPETQVVYTKNERRVARLEPYKQGTSLTQLVSTQPGTLTGLSWHPVEPSQPGVDDVVIQIQATGLNFRDVLIAMGQYPETAPLGCECVGIVTTVGANVSDLMPGQTVMAIAVNSFAQSVTVHRDLVTPVPDGVTPSQAATLPVAFTTAYYSLCHLANLQPGERVLIHAATGGVGQAAVQIAQQVGAEIFATASPSKWDALQSLGVTHIMNSRTLDFADTIMTATNGQGVEVVLNALPGEFRTKSLATLGAHGRFVDIGKGDGLTPKEIAQLRPDSQHFTVDIAALCPQQPERVQSMLHHISQQVSLGAWTPLPVTEFTQGNVVQAFRTVQQAKHVGKVVVTHPPAAHGSLNEIQFQDDAVYLVTGGLGGLGLTIAQWMANHGARHIALLSRREPTATAQETIRTLADQGITITVLSVDVTDRTALERALTTLKTDPRFPGGLRGVIHAAGGLDDGLMQQLDWSQFERVLAPKVDGAWHLHTLTQTTELDFFVLFSSAAALLGSPGQANHAAANAFLDGLAHYRRQAGLPGLSINWGAWTSVGSALKYQQQGDLKHLSGVGVITPEQGLAQMEQIWATPAAQVGIVPINWSEFLTQPRVKDLPFFQNLQQNSSSDYAATLDSTPSASLFLEQLDKTAPEQQRQCLDTYVCQQVCQTLGFQPDELDRQTGFFDLGMDSLTALELKNTLQTNLGISLPSTLVFDYPTVAALLDYLATQLLEGEISGDSENSQDQDPSTVIEVELPSGNALAALMDEKLADIESLLGEGGGS
ncbi:MAG: SDR family NAD(P)-dependent oxidoreductase [Cyanobacteria bacterium P01_A01_bin.15]